MFPGTEDLLPPPPKKKQITVSEEDLLPPPPKKKAKSGGIDLDVSSVITGNSPSQLNGEDGIKNNPFAIGGQYNSQKPDFDKLDLSNTRHDAAIAEQIKNTPLKKIPLTPILDNTYRQKPISEIDIKEGLERTKQHKIDMETAIDNTTLKVLKNKGIVAGKGSPLYEAERKKIEEKTKPTMIGGIVINGAEATYHKDKNGNIGLDRNLGFLEGMRKSFNDAVDGEDEAKAFSNMTTEQRVQYANQKMQANPNPEYMQERNSGVGSLIGGAVPYVVKAAAAGTLATAAVIAAPETGGTSLAGLAPALTVLFTAPDMIEQGAKDEIMTRYMQLKQENPNADEKALMDIAEHGELSGGLLGAANALAYTTTLKLPLLDGSKNVLKKYLNGVASSAVHLGGITAGSKAAQLAERKIEGYHVGTDDAIKEITETFVEGAKAGAVLNGLMSGAHILPKAVKSAMKWAITKQVPVSEVATVLKANVDAGRIPPEVAEQTIADIDGYKKALDKTADGLKPETEASVAGLIQAKDNLIAEMATKDETQHEPYKQKIEALNKQIEKITKTNDPFKYEVDELTGNPIAEKPKVEELPDLSVPIEGTDKKGVPIGEDVPAETTPTEVKTEKPTPSTGLSRGDVEKVKGTKVADKEGNPVVVYHGSGRGGKNSGVIEKFDESIVSKDEIDFPVNGFFFAGRKGEAEIYGGDKNTGSYYVDIKNPASRADVEAAVNEARNHPDYDKEKGEFHNPTLVRKILIEKGFDGYIPTPFGKPNMAKLEGGEVVKFDGKYFKYDKAKDEVLEFDDRGNAENLGSRDALDVMSLDEFKQQYSEKGVFIAFKPDQIHPINDPSLSSNTPSKEQGGEAKQTKTKINEEAKVEVPVPKKETSTTKEQPDKVVPEEGAGEPPKPPKEPIVESEGKDKLNDKGILNHLSSAENVPEVSKKGFEEKGLKYNTSSQKEAESVAKSVIDKYGVDDAVLLAEAQKFDGDVNSLIYAETLNRLAKSESEAKTQEEKIEFAKKFAEVGIKYDEAGRKGGRFSSAINYFYKKSPLGVQMIENAKRKEAFEEWSKPKDKSWKEFFDEMMKEPEFEKEVSVKVKEEMKKERAEARQARIKKVDEFFDKAKEQFKGGAAYSTIIPPKIITAAIDGMKLAYHGGEKVVKLVQDAIDYISEKLGHDTWDKEKFRKEWESKLKDKAEKKPLTDEEIKTKILERFRKKLKGLTDKEKEEVVRKSFQKIVESGGLDYADFKKIISDITGRGELTEAETTRLKELVKETNLVDEAGEKARLERTQEARKNYFDAQTKAAKASKELNELLYNRPNITKRLTSIMQLNTLGIPALVNNPIYNVWNQTTLRLPVGAVKTVIDQAIKYGSVGKIAPETNIVNATVQAEFFSKLGLGTKESLQQFFTGLNRADYTAKEIQGQQIRPASAIRDLWAFFKGKKNLTGEQAIDKTLQATVGIPAEIVARTLNLGDKPQRFAAEGAQAAAFAKALGLKDINYDLFIDFPREEAYRAYKEKGLSDAEASKKADYIKDTIIKEGQRSTFQQDNMLNDVINRAFGGEKSGIGSLAKAITISPYIKIPSNAYWSFYNLINPEIAFLQSAIYGVKAAAKEYGGYKKFLGDKYNTTAAKDLNEAKYWFAHGAVGMATRAAIVAMVGAGIARPSNTADDTKKEREGEQNYEQQGTINVSKLWAAAHGQDPDEIKNGLNVQMRWFGHWGTMADAVAQKNESMTAEQKEKQKDFMDIAFGGMEIDALKQLNQGVFGNTSSLLTAVERKDFQNYGVNLINMFANIVQPAALAQIEKASMPYYTKQKADTFLGELNNTMLSRSKLYRDLTNQYPPSKIGIWGDKVEKKDNFGMRLFGISRANPDNFAQPIYDDYKKTNNIKFFPPSVRPVIEGNGQVINLPTKDAARLEELVGQQRKNMISPYVNDMATFEGSSKTYSQLTDDEKLDKLNIIYDEGYKNGKELFLKEHPEYIIPEKTKQDKREDKKESRANKKFRKAISSKY